MSSARLPGAAGALLRGTARGYRAARCERCGVVAHACFCAELIPLATKLRFVFHMHRLELGKSSNTVRLLTCALAEPRLVLLGMPAQAAAPRADVQLSPAQAAPLVLFPGTNSRGLGPHDAGRTLLVPDGSWSQARKIQQQLVRKLDAEPVQIAAIACAPHESLRKPPAAGLLSTAGAVAAALDAVGDSEAASALRAVHARFIAATFSTRGRRSQHWMQTTAPGTERDSSA